MKGDTMHDPKQPELWARRSARRTKKLIAASEVLAQEYYCDTDDDTVCQAVLAGKLTHQQVYSALESFGYRWYPNRRAWRMTYPRWILNFHKIEERLSQRNIT
jgi:hypothetical protein